MKLALNPHNGAHVLVEYTTVTGPTCSSCGEKESFPGVRLNIVKGNPEKGTVLCAADAESLGWELLQLACKCKVECRVKRLMRQKEPQS